MLINSGQLIFLLTYICCMQVKDSVVIMPDILQDQSISSNHHILKRIIENKEVGQIRSLDVQKSEEKLASLYWVKFHVAAILIDKKYLVKVDEPSQTDPSLN